MGMNMRGWGELLGFIAISQCAGLVGSLFTFSAIPTWYATLTKPELTPPNWVFGPVWTTLFTLMGIAAFLVWKKGRRRKAIRAALMVFSAQLMLNSMWSVLFFGLEDPSAAFVEIVALWFTIVVMIFLFWKIHKTAAWLLAPYILWVTFAGYLNYSILLLN